MKTQLFRLFSFVLVIVLLLSGSARLANAQEAQSVMPPASNVLPPDGPHAGPRQAQNGQWYMPEEQAALMAPASEALPASTGGPDDFGYTWNNAVPLAWINAKDGVNRTSNAVALGFSFKFYENTYSQIYLSQYGYAAFSDDLYDSQSEIPSPASPNNVIAPYWAPVYAVNGYIRYLTGGTAPNRYFVAEWNKVGDNDFGEEHTFEMVLYENSDIVFQYKTMTYGDSYWCQASGIEDSQGMDGLSITSFCNEVAPNHAVRIYRPATAARVNINPLYQGSFTHPGGTVTFQIPVRNTGELGADVYDLSLSSTWPTSLYAADGATSLTDTDTDGVIDTGSVNQGSTVNIVAKVQTPGGVNVGDALAAAVTARSSLNTSKSKTATLQTAIPAPFAQVYRDDYDGAMSLYLAQPGAQQVKEAANNRYGDDLAVAEAPNGNFTYAWEKFRCVDTDCNIYAYDIEYALLNKYGETVRAASKLTDNSGATISTYDFSPVITAAPDGHIGILWYRELYQYVNNSYQYNYNIFFAVLDASGSVAYGPLNLTNNSSWVTGSTLDIPRFYDPRITPTGDNRFVLAWRRYARSKSCTSNDCYLNDIYYAVRNTGGGEVKGITQFTNDTTGKTWEGYYTPNLTGLTGNRALITWYRDSDEDIYYAVLDSAGNVVKDKTNLSGDGSSTWDYEPDAVQLSDGKIVVAWTAWTGSYNIRFAALDTAYNRTAGPTSLNTPAAATGSGYVSVAADNAGHAILTWMDYNNNYRNLYYALVNGSGGILTQPMIFRTSQASTPYIETSFVGYGNTSYGSLAAGVDAAIWPGSSLAGAAPGGSAQIGLNYANHGQTTATGIVLTANLGTGLTYLGDSSGISPSIEGSLITWNLPDMSFLDKNQFVLYMGVPDTAAIGDRYTVALGLTANETDANASDNTANLEVMAALQVYLPLTRR
jgi:hypothetical protein